MSSSHTLHLQLPLPLVSFLGAAGCFGQCKPAAPPGRQHSLQSCGSETGLQEAEGIHVLQQFGSEKPVIEEASGKSVLALSCGEKAFALYVSKEC